MIEISINADEPAKIEKDTFIKAFETALQNAAIDKIRPYIIFENLPKYEPEELEEDFKKYAEGGIIFYPEF